MATTDITKELGLEQGTWRVINCGEFPSEQNCRLVMMAPEDQEGDLLDASMTHAITSHGHADTPELRMQLMDSMATVEI